tara:strand:+ start:230 stop:517 length:288 start_codon:yes stop_codon:yes gene_type:complete
MRLIKIVKSSNKLKKYDAYFMLDNGRQKKVSFGASGYSDYTINKDDDRKELYIRRHRSRENWNNPLTAGALSRYILWEKKTLKAAITAFKKRFNL